jgi:hypothetical protein
MSFKTFDMTFITDTIFRILVYCVSIYLISIKNSKSIGIIGASGVV